MHWSCLPTAVAVLCKQLVGKISDTPLHGSKGNALDQPPSSFRAIRNAAPNRCRPVILDQDHGICRRAVNIVFGGTVLRRSRLVGGEFEIAFLVAFDHPVDPHRCRITNTVKKYRSISIYRKIRIELGSAGKLTLINMNEDIYWQASVQRREVRRYVLSRCQDDGHLLPSLMPCTYAESRECIVLLTCGDAKARTAGLPSLQAKLPGEAVRRSQRS